MMITVQVSHEYCTNKVLIVLLNVPADDSRVNRELERNPKKWSSKHIRGLLGVGVPIPRFYHLSSSHLTGKI